MKFGSVPLDEAEGAILAHSVTTTAGPLRKGMWLDAQAIGWLRADGHESVIAAILAPDDRHEDDAATALARALVPDPAGQGLRLTPAATGRVNLHTTGRGVMAIDAGAVAAINAVNPMITLATVPLWFRADPDAMVATVKIISYGVPGADLARAVDAAIASAGGVMRLMPPRFRTATLIETSIRGRDPGDKGRAALAGRLARLGMALTPREMVPHDTAAIAAAIAGAPGDVILVLTASATSDPADVAPAALCAAGGIVVQFGIPVDPGNLLFLGHLGARPVIGLPGCARSLVLNRADWVL
jgi:molybdenum cofactor cytidylyltransferase